jgi:hypothetical protein
MSTVSALLRPLATTRRPPWVAVAVAPTLLVAEARLAALQLATAKARRQLGTLLLAGATFSSQVRLQAGRLRLPALKRAAGCAAAKAQPGIRREAEAVPGCKVAAGAAQAQLAPEAAVGAAMRTAAHCGRSTTADLRPCLGRRLW